LSSPTAPQAYRGERLGLPATGRGSIAGTGARLVAFIVDALASGVVAALFVPHHPDDTFANRLPASWSLIPFALDYIVGVLVAGRTIGMYLAGLRLIRVSQDVAVGPPRILGRTALLLLFVPALIFDRDNRGLHDRMTDTAVVRA
jgi:uncharacterized RDD family membrane protein YckC